MFVSEFEGVYVLMHNCTFIFLIRKSYKGQWWEIC